MSKDETQISQVERMADEVVAKARAWIRNPVAQALPLGEDQEFARLDADRNALRRLKYDLLRPLDSASRFALTRRHPVWIIEYDMAITTIQAATPSSQFAGNHVGLACRLMPDESHPLSAFFWCGGAVLRVNTTAIQALRPPHAEGPLPADQGRGVDGLSWDFKGTRWFCPDGVLMLDFGYSSDAVAFFLEILGKEQRKEPLNAGV